MGEERGGLLQSLSNRLRPATVKNKKAFLRRCLFFSFPQVQRNENDLNKKRRLAKQADLSSAFPAAPGFPTVAIFKVTADGGGGVEG